MALLAEYAITPDVFDVMSYSSEEVCGLHLQILKDVLIQEGLVRNLRNGEWARLFAGSERSWHRRGKELLKKLATQKRLVLQPTATDVYPESDSDWCDEAIASHRVIELAGIIISNTIAEAYSSESIVAPIDRLPNTDWWTSRSPSLRLGRTLEDYKAALALVLRHANSIMFIDPHIDPNRSGYRDICSLIEDAGNRAPAPTIEIHRVAWYGSSQDKRPKCAEVEAALRSKLTAVAQRAGLSLEVYLWDDFHDRYLISNLVGINVPNGFDTTRAPNARTTWNRLGRKERDDIQREFDPASGHHTLKGQFSIR